MLQVRSSAAAGGPAPTRCGSLAAHTCALLTPTTSLGSVARSHGCCAGADCMQMLSWLVARHASHWPRSRSCYRPQGTGRTHMLSVLGCRLRAGRLARSASGCTRHADSEIRRGSLRLRGCGREAHRRQMTEHFPVCGHASMWRNSPPVPPLEQSRLALLGAPAGYPSTQG